MLNLFKKVKCENCKKQFRRLRVLNFADRWFCSEKCMREHFVSLTTEELIKLYRIDSKMLK